MRTFHRTICLSAHFIAAALLILGQLLVNPLTMMARTGAPAKPATIITQCGTKITEPGDYTLAGYISGCSGSDGVDIETSNVTLDLAGFGFSTGCIGGCYPSQTGILVADPAGGPISNVRILGGRVFDFAVGMSFFGVSYSQVTGVGLGDYSTTCLSLNENARGDHSHNNLFTADAFVYCSEGVQGNSVYNSKFIGNQCIGLANGTGTGLHILNGSGNVLKGNTCAGETTAIELGGGATGNILLGNQTYSSSTGILVGSGANGNTFIGNYSWGNKVLDIDEGNSGCGTDAWKRNVFKTTNQGCVH